MPLVFGKLATQLARSALSAASAPRRLCGYKAIEREINGGGKTMMTLYRVRQSFEMPCREVEGRRRARNISERQNGVGRPKWRINGPTNIFGSLTSRIKPRIKYKNGRDVESVSACKSAKWRN